MNGASMGTAPLKDDYQALERRLVAKMAPAPRRFGAPRRLGASKRVSGFARAYPKWKAR